MRFREPGAIVFTLFLPTTFPDATLLQNVAVTCDRDSTRVRGEIAGLTATNRAAARTAERPQMR
jgi:hypothetical protein